MKIRKAIATVSIFLLLSGLAMARDIGGNYKILEVNSVAELRLVSSESIADTTARLLGYYAPGDGGGGPTRYFATGAAPGTYVDTGGNIIVPTGGDGSKAWLFTEDDMNIRVWGAKEGNVNATLTTNALKNVLAYAKTKPEGGNAYIPEVLTDAFFINSVILIPEKCGIIGSSSTSSRLQAASGSTFTGGMIENETKTGVGQEFLFLEKLGISGAGSTSMEALIKLVQVYVNSYLRDLVVGDSTGDNIKLVASDGGSPGNGGPIEIQNCWVRSSDGHCLNVDGDFKEINIYGGAFENPGAGFDCIHVDGSPYSGTRAIINAFSPHFEFSNTGSRGFYFKKAIASIYGMTSVGTQEATQYNAYVDTDCDVSFYGGNQSSTVRHGIYFVDSGIDYLNANIGEVSNRYWFSAAGHYSSGQAGADITLDANWTNVLSLSAGSATSIADIENAPLGVIYLRFGNNNYTVRHNANIKLNKGADWTPTTNQTLCLVRIAGVFYEVTPSL